MKKYNNALRSFASIIAIISVVQAADQVYNAEIPFSAINAQKIYEMCDITVNQGDVASVTFNNKTDSNVCVYNYFERHTVGLQFQNHIPVNYVPVLGTPALAVIDTVSNRLSPHNNFFIQPGQSAVIFAPKTLDINTTATIAFHEDAGDGRKIFDLQLYKTMRVVTGAFQSWFGGGKKEGMWMLTAAESKSDK